MSDTTTKIEHNSFPRISSEILNRLGTEADHRTSPPQAMDWKEIHARAKLAQARVDANAPTVGDADRPATSKTSPRRKFGFLANAHRFFF